MVQALFHSRKWPNELILSELLLSLPFTNSKVERMFSLKVIKTDRHNSLQITTLDDLTEINVEGPPVPNISAEHAVDLWWTDCARRPNQRPRKEYQPRETRKDDEAVTFEDDQYTSDTEREFTLNDWDEWFAMS